MGKNTGGEKTWWVHDLSMKIVIVCIYHIPIYYMPGSFSNYKSVCFWSRVWKNANSQITLQVFHSFSLSFRRLAELLASAAQDGSLQKALSIGKPPDMADDEKAGICTIFWASLENTLGTSFAGSASFAVGVQLASINHPIHKKDCRNLLSPNISHKLDS